MPIVAYREGYRNVWMFPRNIRKIPPWKMSNILHIFLMQNKIGWMSDQNVQNEFYKYLEESGLKTEGFLYHPKSGGARTYYSQLMALGLIFRREKDGIRYNFPTIAGEALVKGEKPLGVMQYLLLKHQYPSAYGRRRNVRINPDLRVKPFMFVLQLLNLDGVDKLRNEELAVAVVYGHNHECLSICAEKILELRSGKNFLDILEIPERDTYTPRG